MTIRYAWPIGHRPVGDVIAYATREIRRRRDPKRTYTQEDFRLEDGHLVYTALATRATRLRWVKHGLTYRAEAA